VRLQGKDISPILDAPMHQVRDSAFSTAGTTQGILLRDERWAFIQYGEDARGGIELYDTINDPQQFTNLAHSPAHADTVDNFKLKLAEKLAAVRNNDLHK
jgi:iduronate 2-sulfatase